MAEPIQLKGKEYQPSLAKTLNWIENSTITAIKGLSEIAKGENVDFLQVLMACQNGNEDKIGKMKQEFDGMNSKEQKKFIELVKKLGKN